MRRPGRLVAVLASAVALASCGWLQTGFNAGNTNSNDFEHALGIGDVASLADHVAPGAGGHPQVVGDLLLVVDGLISESSELRVFDRSTCPNASQTPCTPLWSRPGVWGAASDGRLIFVIEPDVGLVALDLHGAKVWEYPLFRDPANLDESRTVRVSNGLVFFDTTRYSGHGSTSERVHLLAASGCGQPECDPIRSYDLTFGVRWAVDGNRLFVVPSGTGASPFVIAYDAASGTELWRSQPVAPYTSMVARDGHLYVVGATPAGVHDYDQAGIGCSGTPKVCAPTRVLSAPGLAKVVAASRDHVLAITGNGTGTVAYWFANGTAGCSGAPLTCAPYARTSTLVAQGFEPGFSFADGVLYIAIGGNLLAYDEAGELGCSGSPRVCNPVTTKSIGDRLSTPVTWDGRIYVGSYDGSGLHVLGPA